LRILAIAPPGGLPTRTYDPGLWWDAVSARDRHELHFFNASYDWWRVACSRGFVALVLNQLGVLGRVHQRALWWERKIDVEAYADAASRALDELTRPAAYQTIADYLATLAPIARHLDALNAAQSELYLEHEFGPVVRNLDYDSSATLAHYSRTDTVLSRSIEMALAQCPTQLGFVAFAVTDRLDLLTSLITARILRKLNPGVHVCLADHGYENYSLHAHIDALRSAGTFDSIFDTVIAQKDDRDDLVPALIDAIEAGDPPRGYLTRADFPEPSSPPPRRSSPPPLSPTFAPEPVFFTRLSARRCYWNKCVYCTQNSKFADTRAPSHSEIRQSLDRIEQLIAIGYRKFRFADEALSPSTLRLLASEIERRKLNFHWACRCKLERAHVPDLFERVAKAGCFEILYGLESTSPRVLKLMGKYTDGVGEQRIAEVFRAMSSVGIAAYIALIGGFPGDTLVDTEGSVNFLIQQASNLRGATYALNKFALFVDTPIAKIPEQYGIEEMVAKGDIAKRFDYKLAPHIRETTSEVVRSLPRLRKRLDDAFGWTPLLQTPEGRMARQLYFASGHSAIFRTMKANPFVSDERFAAHRRNEEASCGLTSSPIPLQS
jgi:hypothetical protein